MQDSEYQIVQDFLSGDRARKAKAARLYADTFDLEQIQSEAVCSGMFVPDKLLEFDRDNLGILEESLSPERMEELENGADPTPGERKRYRASLLRQVKDGDSDADMVPGFWIHSIRDTSGNEIYALTMATGYSFSGISTDFHGLFLWEKDCIEYLKESGVVTGATHYRRKSKKEPGNQISLKFPKKRKKEVIPKSG